jgi:molybdopterin molybdotransferase
MPARRTLAEHQQHLAPVLDEVTDQVLTREVDVLPLTDPRLLGAVTTQAVRTPIDLPTVDNSQMDGFAVCAADLAGASDATPVFLPPGRTTAAGDRPLRHLPGTASPVMTGAPIPEGADAVVPVEEALPPRFGLLVRSDEPMPETADPVGFGAGVTAGSFVRPRGSDLSRGAEIVAAGVRVTPARIGALAAAGIGHVAVRPAVRILVATTGDELQGPPESASENSAGPVAGPTSLVPGGVFDANGPMLTAALRRLGAEVVPVRLPDDPALLLAVLSARAEEADLVVTSGGISAGAFEVVRQALEPVGAEFVGVALQPGGPQGSGHVRTASGREVPLLCFPGNPVSTLLSAELFLLPTLRALRDLPPQRESVERVLAHDVTSPSGKHQVRRGRMGADGRVSVSPPGSHLLADLADAQLLVHIPLGVEQLDAGTPVQTWRFDD